MNKNRWVFTLFLSVLVFCPKEVSAKPPITLSVHLDKSSVTVGDEIVYEIRVQHPRDVVVRFPDEKFDFSPFELKHYRPLSRREADGEVTEGIHYFLTIFKVGVSKIPPIPVSYLDYRERGLPSSFSESGRSIEGGVLQGSVVTEPVEITVVSVLGKEAEPTTDIQKLKTEKENWVRFLVRKAGKFFLIVGAICVGLYGIIRLLPKPHRILKREDPVQSSLRDLGKVRKGIEKGGAARDHTEILSKLLRRYLADQFDPLSLHLTTSELCTQMLHYPPCRAITEKVQHLLSTADLVKFANRETSQGELNDFVKEAEEIIRYQKPEPPGPAPS